MNTGHLSCCGIHELVGVGNGYDGHSTPEGKLDHYLRSDPYIIRLSSSINPRCAFFVFSEAGHQVTYGADLAAYIEAQKLGIVTRSVTKVNPNSNNPLTVYLWAIDRPALTRYAAKKGIIHVPRAPRKWVAGSYKPVRDSFGRFASPTRGV